MPVRARKREKKKEKERERVSKDARTSKIIVLFYAHFTLTLCFSFCLYYKNINANLLIILK